MTVGQQRKNRKPGSALNMLFEWKFELEEKIELLDLQLKECRRELAEVKDAIEKEELVVLEKFSQHNVKRENREYLRKLKKYLQSA